MISDQWSLITVVVEYPRIRFYKNSELFHNAYIPIPSARKRFNIAKPIGAVPADAGRDRSAEPGPPSPPKAVA